jgi:hypothetical protein
MVFCRRSFWVEETVFIGLAEKGGRMACRKRRENEKTGDLLDGTNIAAPSPPSKTVTPTERLVGPTPVFSALGPR